MPACNLTERGIAFTAFSELWQYRMRHCVLLELISITGSIWGWPDVHSQSRTPISGCQDFKRTTTCKSSQIMFVLQKLLQLLGFSFAKGSNNINKWCLCLREPDCVTIPTAVFPFNAGVSLQGSSKSHSLSLLQYHFFTVCKIGLINNNIVRATVWSTKEFVWGTDPARINNQTS